MDLERRFRVPPSGFHLAERDPGDVAGLDKDAAAKRREADLDRLDELQERLYAESRRALLVVLQALDAAGKDGTIEHVMGGMNPQGVRVTPFKEPTRPELAHDFLWRAQLPLPAHGEIGIYNRSHYEEVLVSRVHPELLAPQAIDPSRAEDDAFWAGRYEDIATWERHLTRSGTRVVKFFLHVSKAEQRRRFLARADEPEKRWKFSEADVREHARYDDYQRVYDATLRATSTKHEPWYVIPADHKWFLRTAVAAILVHHLEEMDPRYPQPSPEELAAMQEAVKELLAEE
jgi:PPK2 family polyphosphate:nucleotide phosphotransferase